MIGTIGKINNRTGGFIIVNKIENTNNISISIPPNSKLLCLNCKLENEDKLIRDKDIIKNTYGYDIISGLDDILITRETESALTVLNGREILYADGVLSGDTMIFNLPVGARVNKTIVPKTGEIGIPVNTNYLIEY